MDIVSEIIAAEIGCAELLDDPRYPDDERHCMEIVKSWMCRVSPNIRLARGEGGRERTMVNEWRSAAQRVVAALETRGIKLR